MSLYRENEYDIDNRVSILISFIFLSFVYANTSSLSAPTPSPSSKLEKFKKWAGL